MNLHQRFDAYLNTLRLPRGGALVAVSGGPHSLALLDLLVQAPSAEGLELAVLHVDHGIHPESAGVSVNVAAVASRYGLSFDSIRLDLGPRATETEARRRRYAWFEERLAARGAKLLFTAHHRDDQIETILMRVLRGSGPGGLAGISVRRGPYVRPLLPFAGEDLARHARAAGLTPWSDPANLDPRHLRSRLRHEIIPRLRTLVPELDENLLRLAWQARDSRAAWDLLLETSGDLEYRQEAAVHSVAVPPLRGYDSPLARSVIRAVARRAGSQPSLAEVARIHRLVRQGDTGRLLQLGDNWRAELAFGRLRLFREAAQPPLGPVPVSGSTGSAKVGGWQLDWRLALAPDRLERTGVVSWFTPEGPYGIRTWCPGDRVRPLRGRGARLVVRCMQDAKVPKSERIGWPVVELEGGIVWVPGVCRGETAVPEAGAPALRIDARRP